MGVDVTIKNRQLFKKPLSISGITMGKYAYGNMDDYWRRQDGLIQGFNILYNPAKIGRGIEFEWKNNLKDEINLRVNFLSTGYDIDMFYDVIRNIMHVWKAKTVEREGEQCTEEDLIKYCQSDKEFNIKFLSEQKETITVFGAEFPLDIDFQAIKDSLGDNLDEGYADYLHKLQSIDAFYAAPVVYRLNENRFFCNYAITSTVDTIFPKKASAPILFKNPNTGKQLECDLFTVTLVSIEDKGAIGRMSFDDFAKTANIAECPEFDSKHVLLKGFSEKEIHALAASEHTDPLAKE